jgi:hypothetical protein
LQGGALLLVWNQNDQQKKASDVLDVLEVVDEKERRTTQ